MPNCNDLIKKIYQTSTQNYDPATRHYTFAFWLHSPYDQFFSALEQKLRLRMGNDVLAILDAAERDLPSLNAEFRDAYDAHCEKYYHPSFNFVFVCAVDSSKQSKEKLVQMLEWISGIRKIQDMVTVILTVPLGGDTVQTMADLDDVIFTDTNVYLYTLADQASGVRKNTLTDSITAVAIINSYRDVVIEHERRRAQALEKANQFQNRVEDPSLREQLSYTERKLWSSLHAKYFDCRVDLFFGYCQEMCRQIKPLSRDVVYTIMDDLYAQVKFEPESLDLLLHAIGMIPMVEPPSRKKQESDSSLELRFERMYGRNGHKVVDLSLKTTLAHMQGTAHMMSISYYVVEMFRRLLPYRLPNTNSSLLEEFKQFLNDYIGEQTKAMESKEHKLRQTLKMAQDIDESSAYDVLTQYVRAYIDVHMLQTRIRFWSDIRSFLITPHDEIESICLEANKNMMQIREFEEQCAENRFGGEPLSPICVEPCTILDVLNFLNGDESASDHYQAIRSMAQKKQASVNLEIDNRIEDVFSCELVRYTYEDQPVQFVSDTYTIRAFERNGKYIIG